jgi:hypothetical protein
LQEIFVNRPLHPSYIADTEILDEKEFGESSTSRSEDAQLSAAEELGLMVCINADSTPFSLLVMKYFHLHHQLRPCLDVVGFTSIHMC